jgi:Protein of unknown function (DUF2815)
MANIISPPLATGKVNLTTPLNELFPDDLSHKPNKFALDLRISLDTKDPKELNFISQLVALEEEMLKDLKPNTFKSDYSLVIDPSAKDFKKTYTGKTLSTSDYTIRCKFMARKEKPKAKSYEIIKIVDRKANLITIDQGLECFVDGCNVIAVIELVRTEYQKKVGVSAYLKGLQFHSAGEPFQAESISFAAIDLSAGDRSFAPPLVAADDELVAAFL